MAAACPADYPPWIGVDQEGGRVSRLSSPVVQLPAMRALGDLDDPSLTRWAARHLGRQLRALGFNIDFAPVLDVDSNPKNPVIGDRSFGRDAVRVVRHAHAFARGLGEAGVLSCGKHFPGHGDTDLDSHLTLPRLGHERQRLTAVELAPFAALARELPALMTAHIVFEAFDRERPATLSPLVLQDLLRGELGFEGVLFSDDLQMRAIADSMGIAQAACDAIAAGCDAVLICNDVEACLEAHAAICRRAESDPAFAARLREAVTRSLSLRRRHAESELPLPSLGEALAPEPTRALEEHLALLCRR